MSYYLTPHFDMHAASLIISAFIVYAVLYMVQLMNYKYPNPNPFLSGVPFTHV